MNSRHAVLAALVVLFAAGAVSAARPDWAGSGKLKAGKCQEGVNCADCKNKNKCNQCLEGQALKGNRCVDCKMGFVAVRNRCKKCPKFCAVCLTPSKCAADGCIPPAVYNPKSKKCKKPKAPEPVSDIDEPETEA